MSVVKPYLTLITLHFPCALSGDFFEDTIPFLTDSFNIRIISLDTTNDQTRKLPKNVVFTRMPEQTKINYQLGKIPFLFKRIFWKQVIRCKKLNCLSMHAVSSILSVMSKSHHLAKYLKSREEYKSEVPLLYYSFISNDYIFAPIFAKMDAKKNVKSIIRCRGIDIERFEKNRLAESLIESVDKHSDSVYFDCEDRMNYFIKQYANKPADPFKYMVSRFGTEPHKPAFTEKEEGSPLSILTRTPQDSDKSILLFIKALSEVKNGKIKWTHIGKTPDIEESALKHLQNSQNVEYKLLDSLSYPERIAYYEKEHFDCLVYLSSMHCLPFEIIECMSCGIFPVALDIGGINEIVNEENGLLLPSDIKSSELTKVLEIMASFGKDILYEKCNQAYETFLKQLTAEKNSSKLTQQLMAVLGE